MMSKVVQFCEKYERLLFIAVFSLGLFIRLVWIGSDFNITADLPILRTWIGRLQEEGVVPFYTGAEIRAYPPLTIYLLAAAGWLADAFSNFGNANDALVNALIKLPAILADIGTAVLLVWQARQRTAFWGILTAGLYLLNPAVWYVSVYWGQIDAIYLFFLIAALMLLGSGRVAPAWICYTLSVAVKVQGLPLAFLFLVWTLVYYGRKALMKGAAAATVTGAIITLPWLISGRISEVIEATTSNSTLRVVQTAYNSWYLILGERVSVEESANRLSVLSISYQTMGLTLFFAVAIFVAVVIIRGKKKPSLPTAAIVLSLAAFLFLTDMRERYLFPVIPLLLWAVNEQRRLLWLYLLLTATWFFNLVTVASFAPQWWTNLVAWQRPYPPQIRFLKSVAVMVSATHLLVFMLLFLFLIKNFRFAEEKEKNQ